MSVKSIRWKETKPSKDHQKPGPDYRGGREDTDYGELGQWREMMSDFKKTCLDMVWECKRRRTE